MFRAPRRLAVGLLTVGALLTLAACQPLPGAAAYVGNTRIAERQVDDIVTSSLSAAKVAPASVDLAQFRQRVTTQLVLNALLARAGDRLGVHVDSAAVTRAIDADAARAGGRQAYLAAAAQRGQTLQILELTKTTQLLAQGLEDKLVADVTVPDAALRQAYTQAGGAATGQSYEQALPALRRMVLRQEAQNRLQAYLTRLVGQVSVRINPRYGQFDAKTLSVTPASQPWMVAGT